MEYTPNAHLKKPGYTDTVDIQDLNDNFDIADGHIGGLVMSENGSHDLRFNKQDKKLQFYSASHGVWVDATGKDAGKLPPSPILDDNSWQTIHSVSENGANYWSVGDCKSVLVNGTIGTLSVNQTFWAYILGFNHNEVIEGKGIHFGCFKTAQTDGVDVCLVDNVCGSSSTNGTKYFQMNHWGSTNYGGWAACDMRYDILGSTDNAPTPYGSAKTTSATGQDPSTTCATNPVPNTLMAALPADLRAVMQPITKYTDNKGNKSNVAETVTKTIDYLPLLAEFEADGVSYGSQNDHEKEYQGQYAYYSSGNSLNKYKHSNIGSIQSWFTRCAATSGGQQFVAIYGRNDVVDSPAGNSSGISPIFKV